jgi:two-component system, sensor histidine kinase and response regulator
LFRFGLLGTLAKLRFGLLVRPIIHYSLFINEVMTGTILLIEDTPDTIKVLRKILKDEGFKVLIAQDGPQGIQRAEYTQPDLILLDIMMPGMNGFEVCALLKSQENTKDIPIIFMTALSDTADKVKGLMLGAVDYVTKPIQTEEVLARVVTHVKLRQQKQQLQEELRTGRDHTVVLEKRNIELNTFARTVAHDLKNPLNAVINFSELLLEDQGPFDPATLEYLQHIAQAGRQMNDIIDALLLLAGAKQGNVEPQPLDMNLIVNQVVEKRLFQMIKGFHGEIHFPDQWPVAQGYGPWVEEIWANYISNGLKYGGQPPCLELGGESEGGNLIRFWVRDNGPGLGEEEQMKLFTPFTRLHQGRAEGNGLGLSIVQQIAEKLGGEVGVESIKGEGSLFYFTLPK